MIRSKVIRNSTKEESIAFRLAGKIKNFTGRGPVVIKVHFEEKLVTVQLKWILTRLEKKFLIECNDKKLVESMRLQLKEEVEAKFLRAFSEVLDNEIKIIDVNEEALQEKLTLQAELWELVS